jgi:hypothetical protein
MQVSARSISSPAHLCCHLAMLYTATMAVVLAAAFLHPVHVEMQTRFLHHLLPLAKEPAEAGESAAVQQLRAKLKDLNEHGPYFMPWCVMPLAKQPNCY